MSKTIYENHKAEQAYHEKKRLSTWANIFIFWNLQIPYITKFEIFYSRLHTTKRLWLYYKPNIINKFIIWNSINSSFYN